MVVAGSRSTGSALPNSRDQVARLLIRSVASSTVIESKEGAPTVIALDELERISVSAPDVKLEPTLESLGDPYPTLRQIWPRVLENGTLTIAYGSGGSYRLTYADAQNLLRLTGFQAVTHYRAGTGHEIVSRRLPREAKAYSCSVVVPCRNELDNVEPLVQRVPTLGTETEIVFVDGASTDGTPERIELVIKAHPEKRIRLIRQEGNTGKAGATFQGFARAEGDVVMILDADMTVRPEDLPRFFDALSEGVAHFANGTRLVYPMAFGAMPALNTAGNYAFSRYLSWLIGSRISDTLCGTKAMLRGDIPRLLALRPSFGCHDPWGDFDLILGAAAMGLSIVDVPIVYMAREAGESKMRPFEHGSELAKTCLVGIRELKLRRRKRGPA